MNLTALLPIKNGESWIPRILPCIRENLRDGDELIVVDDGSRDRSLDLITKFGTNLRLRILRNPGHGLVDALNFGISESRTNWIARFDVDDTYSSSRLEIQRNRIKPGVVAIFSDYVFVTESGDFLGEIPSPVSHFATTVSLINSQRTAHPSSLISKEAFNKVGGYRKQDFPAEDLSLWIRLSRVGELASIPEPLLKYTLRKASITGERYYLAKNRHSELFAELSFGEKEAALALENLEETLTTYRGLANESLRRLLHLFDLKTAIQMGFLPRKHLSRLVPLATKELCCNSSLRSVLTQIYFKNQRRRFRELK